MTDPEITDPRDPYKWRGIVAELDAELALIEPLPYRVPIHALARRARDEIARLRAENGEMRRTFGSHPLFKEARDAALEEAAQVCDEPTRRLREELGWSAEAELLERYAAAIRALKADK